MKEIDFSLSRKHYRCESEYIDKKLHDPKRVQLVQLNCDWWFLFLLLSFGGFVRFGKQKFFNCFTHFGSTKLKDVDQEFILDLDQKIIAGDTVELYVDISESISENSKIAKLGMKRSHKNTGKTVDYGFFLGNITHLPLTYGLQSKFFSCCCCRNCKLNCFAK